ncbi:MAG: tryptophan synthase subunit alpha [Pyrinomonadaceae bacterium]
MMRSGAIANKFADLADAGQKGFIPFITAGDPDENISLTILLKLAELGADTIELGVPFSDPMADGPTIQRSSQRALSGGTTLNRVLELAGKFRASSDVPLVLFSYFNPIMSYGIKTFADAASAYGIDGLLLTDVVDDEANTISDILNEKGIDLISLIAPTTGDKRLRRICSGARGFLYAIARAGVTGARTEAATGAEALVRRARKFTNLPIAVGFGISSRGQVENVWEYADAAIVGSAIVAEIEGSRPGDEVANVERLVRELTGQVALALDQT